MASYEEYEEATASVAMIERLGPNAIRFASEDEEEIWNYDDAMARYGYACKWEADARRLFTDGEIPEAEVFRCSEFRLRLARALDL